MGLIWVRFSVKLDAILLKGEVPLDNIEEKTQPGVLPSGKMICRAARPRRRHRWIVLLVTLKRWQTCLMLRTGCRQFSTDKSSVALTCFNQQSQIMLQREPGEK